jgi:hypothetical protein
VISGRFIVGLLNFTRDMCEEHKTKACSICKSEFPLTSEFFYKNAGHKDGFATKCKKCYHIRSREILPEGFKRCTKCGEIKRTSEYHKTSLGDSRQPCKKCRRRNPNKEVLPDGFKRCSRCKTVKSHEEFGKRKNRNNRPVSFCKECAKVRGKEKYHENPQVYIKRNKEFFKNNLDYGKRYYSKNKDRLLVRSKKWIKNNRHKINNYTKTRYAADVNYKLAKILRARFRDVFIGRRKGLRIMRILGCDLLFFRAYIESQFEIGMSWDNFGKYGWHLDHCRPVASIKDFTDTQEIEEVFGWLNYRPLWWDDNIKKSSWYNGVKYYHQKCNADAA